jgi:hypothetical protein
MEKYLLTIENRGRLLNFEAESALFTKSGSPIRGREFGFGALVITKTFDHASTDLSILARNLVRVKKITIRIEKFIGRARSIRNYATVSDALLTDIGRHSHSGKDSELVAFEFDPRSVKFG